MLSDFYLLTGIIDTNSRPADPMFLHGNLQGVEPRSIVLIWQVLFDYNGVVNVAVQKFGGGQVDWLKSSAGLLVIILLFLWKNLGYNMILFLSAMGNIPKDIIEVAELDGANRWQIFLHVKLLFGAIGGVGQALGLILLPVLSKKFTRNRVIKGSMLLSIIGYLGMGLFGPVLNQFILFAIFGIVGCTGIGCMFVAETIMLADIVDYGEFKLGYRTDSIVFSMKSLLLKVAYSIQSLIIGAGLQLSHYDGELVKQGISQPASAQNALSIPPAF